MKVLGINGSPRKGGNTDILLDKVLEGAISKGAQVEKVVLNDLNFSPCQECENISDNRGCIVRDDMQLLYPKIKEADAIVVASPIFFGSLTAQTKMMIDRFQCEWRSKFILKKGNTDKKKTGIFISVEASRREDFFDNARAIVKNFFATINAEYTKELFCPGIDDKGKILSYPEILKSAFEIGKNILTD